MAWNYKNNSTIGIKGICFLSGLLTQEMFSGKTFMSIILLRKSVSGAVAITKESNKYRPDPIVVNSQHRAGKVESKLDTIALLDAAGIDPVQLEARMLDKH